MTIHEKLDSIVNATVANVKTNLTEVYAGASLSYKFTEDANYVVIMMGGDSNTGASVALTTSLENYLLSSSGYRCGLWIVFGKAGSSITGSCSHTSTYYTHEYMRVFKIL